MIECYYHGVWEAGGAGHYLRAPDGRAAKLPHDFPLREATLDGGLLHGRGVCTGYGKAIVAYIGDWTIISFWDGSGDSRPGSNSTFALRGTHKFCEVLEIAEKSFPTLFARFGFKIVEGKAPNFGAIAHP